jgi:hypothetical protein
MGLAGLIAAPAAFLIARALQKGAAEALGVVTSSGQPVLILACLKAVEYGCLGVLVAWLAGTSRASFRTHILVGFCLGMVFGTLALITLHQYAPNLATSKLIARGVNEVLFPIGCSLVLFVGGIVAKRL